MCGGVVWMTNVEMQERLPSKVDVYQPDIEATQPLFVKPREWKVLRRMGAPFVVQKEGNVK